MNKLSLDALVRDQMARASQAPGGRSAETVYGGHEHALRQTIIALTAGSTQTEHENPGEATVYVLRGRVRLGRRGGLLGGPPRRSADRAAVSAHPPGTGRLRRAPHGGEARPDPRRPAGGRVS